MLSIYRLVPWIYLLLPIAAAAWAVRARRRGGRPGALRSVAGLCFAGSLMGVALTLTWSDLLGANVSPGQMAVAAYWISATLCGLGAVGLLLGRLLNVVLRVCLAPRQSYWRWRLGAAAGMVAVALRGALLSGVALGILAATVISFRPKVVHPGNPQTILHHAFETIDFPATDGVHLRGWWIAPAEGEPSARDTVLLCHGFGADKAVALPLARDLVDHGFNVLAFDFRAHGESGGQLCTFGDTERRDVLGAVRWLRASHPTPGGRILGLGVDMGAVALIGAASDPSLEGQSIDAVAAVDPFDQLDSLIDALAEQRETPVAGWIISHVAVPLAGLQCGVDLRSWSPDRDAQMLWPRPLLVIQAGQDSVVPLSAGQILFEDALQPKYQYWIEDETPHQVMFEDRAALGVIRVFFRGAKTII
jgi:fermentation-respiration switch protein FrsA (DUF1100 family)